VTYTPYIRMGFGMQTSRGWRKQLYANNDSIVTSFTQSIGDAVNFW